MPRLPDEKAKRVDDAESGGFAPLPPGVYIGRLMAVTEGQGDKGPYWTWEYDILDEGFTNRKVWNTTSLSNDSEWKMKETFEAFGVPASTDTGELLGCTVSLGVSQRTIQKGARAGQLGNNVDTVSWDDDPEASHPAGAVGASKAGWDEEAF